MSPRATFAIVSTALFMVVLDNLVVTTALPSIREDLGATIQSLEWTVNAYTLTFAVLLLTGAALGDRFGRKRMFGIGLGIFTLSSAAAALAPSTEALIAARAVQGPGAAGWCSGCGRASPGSPSRSGRWSAAPSSTASRGTGSSGSTSRSASR
jgi:MFS family permease